MLEPRRLLSTWVIINTAPELSGEGATAEINLFWVWEEEYGAGGSVGLSLSGSAAGGDDYILPPLTILIPSNSQPVPSPGMCSFDIPIKLDNLVEGTETLTVTLTDPDPGDNVTLGPPGSETPPSALERTIDIQDRPAFVTITKTRDGSEDPTASGAESPAVFSVTRSGGDPDAPLTVSYNAFGSGSSPADEADFAAGAGTVTIPAGQGSTSLELGVTDDDEIEAAYEGATVALTGGGLGAAYTFWGFDPATNPNPTAPYTTTTIQDNDFEIVCAKAWFNDQGLKGDDGVAYGTPWVDWDGNGDVDGANEQKTPISYFRSDATTDRFVQAMIYFEVEGNPTAPDYKISGTGAGPGGGAFEEAKVDLQANGATRFLYAEATSATQLPTSIEKGDLTIAWSITPNNRPAKHVAYGSTTNEIYVTGAAAPGEFETVVKLGCEGAGGLRPAEVGELEPGASGANRAVVNGIWNQFSGNSVQRMDGETLVYNHASGTGMTAPELLSSKQGQCTAWTDLLVRVLNVQGVSGVSEQDIEAGANYDAFRVSAATGQGKGAPATEFGFHRVVRFAGQPDAIYDPSYGIRTEKSDWRSVEVKYEDLYVSHLRLLAGNWVPNPHSDPNDGTDPDQKQLVWS